MPPNCHGIFKEYSSMVYLFSHCELILSPYIVNIVGYIQQFVALFISL